MTGLLSRYGQRLLTQPASVAIGTGAGYVPIGTFTVPTFGRVAIRPAFSTADAGYLLGGSMNGDAVPALVRSETLPDWAILAPDTWYKNTTFGVGGDMVEADGILYVALLPGVYTFYGKRDSSNAYSCDGIWVDHYPATSGLGLPPQPNAVHSLFVNGESIASGSAAHYLGELDIDAQSYVRLLISSDRASQWELRFYDHIDDWRYRRRIFVSNPYGLGSGLHELVLGPGPVRLYAIEDGTAHVITIHAEVYEIL